MKALDCGTCGHCSLSCELALFRQRVELKKARRRVLDRSARPRVLAAPAEVFRSIASLAADIADVTSVPYADVVEALRKGRTYEDLVPRRAS